MTTELNASRIHCEITPLSNTELFVLLNNNEAKFDYPVHYHSDYELNLVMSATGNRIVGDSIEPFAGNDLVLIGPRIPHAWRTDTKFDDKARVITVQFDEKFSNAFTESKKVFEPIHNMLTLANSGIRFKGEIISEVAKELNDLCESKGFTSVLKFYEILNILASAPETSRELLTSSSFDSSSIVRQSRSRRIERICKYIDENYAQDITLNDIAELANMSTSTVSHFFKRRTSRTFSTYLTDIRIGNAARLLIDTTRSINDIAYDCGFGNISNFNRVFKKYKNCTPRDFRANASAIITKY